MRLGSLLFWLVLVVSLSLCVSAGADYYGILGVSRDATEKEIRSAYRKLSVANHPDKHPEAKDEYTAKFMQISDAYQVLSNPEKRDIYNRYGEEGIKQSEQGGGGPGGPGGFGFQNPFTMFEQFFGGGGMPGGMHYTFTTGGPGGGEFGGQQFFQRGGGEHEQQRQRERQRDLFEDSDVVGLDDRASGFVFGSGKREAGEMWVVMFYASQESERASKAAGEFKKLAKSFNNMLKVAAVDCSSRGGQCSGIGVSQRSPVKIKMYPFDGQPAEEYPEDSPMSVGHLDSWVVSSITDTVPRVTTEKSLDDWRGRTVSKTRALFFVANPRVASSVTLRVLAKQLHSLVAIAIAPSSGELAERFSVKPGDASAKPKTTLVAIAPGATLDLHQTYEGPLSFANIRDFLIKFSEKAPESVLHRKPTSEPAVTVEELRVDGDLGAVMADSSLSRSPLWLVLLRDVSEDADAKGLLTLLATKYKSDGLSVVWSTSVASKWSEVFPPPEGTPAVVEGSFVVLKPSRSKYSWSACMLPSGSPVSASLRECVESWLDRVVGGEARWSLHKSS